MASARDNEGNEVDSWGTRATSFCMGGALSRVSHENRVGFGRHKEAEAALIEGVYRHVNRKWWDDRDRHVNYDVSHFNDFAKGVEEVTEAFDRAIEVARERERKGKRKKRHLLTFAAKQENSLLEQGQPATRVLSVAGQQTSIRSETALQAGRLP